PQLFPLSRVWFPARGEVLLGGVDPDKFIGPLALMPVVGEGHWMLHLLAVYVGGASRRQAGLHVILDTGTNGMYMPAKAREDMITLIRFGLQKPIDIRLNGSEYEIDCADRKYLPTIELSFEGVDGKVSTEVPQENYVEEIQSLSTTSCVLLFLENTEGFWRIGQNVIPGYYYSFDFDKKQIGVARSISQSLDNQENQTVFAEAHSVASDKLLHDMKFIMNFIL
ncbi:hypothetical protein FOZ60_016508, partial [Perkinsus olseni]